MKFKEINRQRYLSNTPLLKWIKLFAYSSTVLAGAYSVYFHYYKAEEYLESFSKYTKDLALDSQIKHQDKLNKPLQKQAYKNYLQEQRLYQDQLNEETRLRLERIRQASLALPEQIAQTKTSSTTVEPSTPVKPLKKSWRSYLTFGYWPDSKKQE